MPLSLQETQQLFEKPEYKSILEDYVVQKDHGFYDHDAANLFGIGLDQQEHRTPALNQDDANKLAETVKSVPLSRMIKEFLAKSGTTGLNGAAYLIPLKIYSTLATYAASRDIINDISMVVIPAAEIPGATLDIDIARYGSYVPHALSSGGKQVEEEIEFDKATLNFTKPWGINFSIGNDLIEDSQFSLIDMHVRMAGEQMGKYSTTKILAKMLTTTDGSGTLLTESAGNDTTLLDDVNNAQNAVLLGFEVMPDSHLAPYWVYKNGIIKDTTYFPSGSTSTWRESILHHEDPKIWGLNWIECNHPSLTTIASSLPTASKSYVFCKQYSYISGRKRWLRLENYSDPVRDLVGATITARQDTVSVYNQSVCQVNES
jgi:hypothetical protein